MKPATVTAGSNQATAGSVQDDDETTHWASDGKLANAWIEWQLGSPQMIDEVVLKPIGWRLRSYPPRITVTAPPCTRASRPRAWAMSRCR